MHLSAKVFRRLMPVTLHLTADLKATALSADGSVGKYESGLTRNSPTSVLIQEFAEIMEPIRYQVAKKDFLAKTFEEWVKFVRTEIPRVERWQGDASVCPTTRYHRARQEHPEASSLDISIKVLVDENYLSLIALDWSGVNEQSPWESKTTWEAPRPEFTVVDDQMHQSFNAHLSAIHGLVSSSFISCGGRLMNGCLDRFRRRRCRASPMSGTRPSPA